MAYTKDQFLQVIRDSIQQYPELAALYQVGDARILQHQAAVAQMMAMMSQQIEIGMSEPFDKARDSTVLADAALKGIVPMGVPPRMRVTVENPTVDAYTLAAGRTLFDSAGNVYRVDTPVTVPGSGTGTAELLQETITVIQHVVTASQPFYRIQLPDPEDGTFISGVTVQAADATPYEYRNNYLNVTSGTKVFNMECNEYERLFIVFGYGGVVGYQPAVGEVITVTVSHTNGDVRPAPASPFSLEYTYTPQDGQIKLSMDALLTVGALPVDISTLRELTKYPSTYDANAVYLGEFDSLVRRNLPNLQFLSIWNEQLEESVRGASLNNINRLFIAVVPQDGENVEAIKAEITRIITTADDSYSLLFVDPSSDQIGITITASVGRINDAAAVKQQIIDAVLSLYGESAPATQAGMLVVQNKLISDTLKKSVIALQDSGSDYSVIVQPPPTTLLPELYRFATASSLTVTVTLANYNLGQWGR